MDSGGTHAAQGRCSRGRGIGGSDSQDENGLAKESSGGSGSGLARMLAARGGMLVARGSRAGPSLCYTLHEDRNKAQLEL